MVNTLPPSIRLKLEQTLAQWQGWKPGPRQQPQPTQVLGQGLSNFSVKVSVGDYHWVVRIDGVAPEKLGLSRAAEWRALQCAASTGLAPVPVYQNPALGCLVCEYTEQVTLTELSQELECVARLLRDIHALPLVKFRLEPLDRVRRYLAILGEDSIPKAFDYPHEVLSAPVTDPVLCHNDLLRANRLWTGDKLLALDWEYVAIGDPFFDLAVIVEGDEMNNPDAELLLCAYLGRPPCAQEMTRLNQQRRVYCVLSELWSRAHARLGQNNSQRLI